MSFPELLAAPPDGIPAPVLVVPRGFEPGFCALRHRYRTHVGQ